MYVFAGYHSKKILQDSNHAHLKIIFTFIIIYSAFRLVLHMHSMMDTQCRYGHNLLSWRAAQGL